MSKDRTMKSTMIALSLLIFSTVLNLRADELLNTAPTQVESALNNDATSKGTGLFASLAQITFKKAFAVVAAAGIVTVGLYKLYEHLAADKQDDETRMVEQQDMLTLTDQQRKLIEDFATAVDACDLVAIQAFDFEEFPIDIMLLLHWARMDVLAVHEQQADQEAIENYRHTMALALRGLAHPDEVVMQPAAQQVAVDCA